MSLLMSLNSRYSAFVMTPQFASAELNLLLQLELAEGSYQSPEDALLAGLRILRENRDFQAQLADRLASLRDGRAIVVEGDAALGEFLDAIDAEVDNETRAASGPGA
jgi:hypothetical protein